METIKTLEVPQYYGSYMMPTSAHIGNKITLTILVLHISFPVLPLRCNSLMLQW